MKKRQMSQRRDARRKQVRQYRISICGIIGVLLLLAVMLGVRGTTLKAKNDEYRMQEAQLEAQLEEQQRREQELDELEEYVGSDEYVADVAKDKLGLAYEDEIIFEAQP